LPGPLLAVYEAGPTGYGLARGATERSLDVRVCAPGSIPRAAGDRVKTDRRDAERLARLLLSGGLSFVRVPTPEEESFRDLIRCREAIRSDLMRARHRVTKFLLRRELRWEGSACAWTLAHWHWLEGLELAEPAARVVLGDYICAVRSLEQRREATEREISELWPSSPWAETIARLRCLRGVDTLTALGLCAEAGDLRRFRRPSSLTGYFGIVPSEYSSGEMRRRGPITKAGSPHARRLLVEAAPTTTATSPGSPATWSAASEEPTRERGRSAGGLNAACTPAGCTCARSGASRQRGAGRPRTRARLLRLGGRATGLRHTEIGRPDAVGAARAKRDQRVAADGLRCLLGQQPGQLGRRARFKTASQATNQRSWGSQPPHMRLTMHSTSLGSARVAPRAPLLRAAPRSRDLLRNAG
jgi:transposase